MEQIVNFYIDGFNWYHPIDNYYRITGTCYKWLDYRKLCESLLSSEEKIGTIYFFTAIRQDFKAKQPDKYSRHLNFNTALKSRNIIIVEGGFKKRSVHCKVACNHEIKTFTKFEEKRTDVNIAVYMLRDALLNKFDKAMLLSADTDLVPVLEQIKENSPYKSLDCVSLQHININNKECYFPRINELTNLTAQYHKIKLSRLKQFLLPDIIKYKNKIINKPTEYN